MSKRTFASVAVALLLAAGAQAQAVTTVKLATLAPRNSSFHQILMELSQKWRAEGVQLNIYTDGTQGTESQMVNRIKLGQLHAGLLTATGLAEIDNSTEALQSMPMMFRSLEEVDYVRNRLRADIEQRLNDKGFVVLFWADAGWVRFFSKDPVIHPEDLKKMKIFVTSGDMKSLEIMKAMGLNAQPLSPNDVLTALQTGMINAIETVPTIALAGQFYGKANHMLDINFAPLVGGLVISKKVWAKFPVEKQLALVKTAREAGEKMKLRVRAENDQAVVTMVRNKLVVHKMTPALEAEWATFAEAAYPRIRGELVPAKFFDDVKRLLAEYRSKPKPAGK